jgi:hypothetical protein
MGSLPIGILITWIIIIGVLYLIGSFIVDKISERYCWLESSKQLGYIVVWLLIGFLTYSWIFVGVLIVIQFIKYIVIYKRERYLMFVVENEKYRNILQKLNDLGFDGIRNFGECINFDFKGDDIYIINSILRNYKCRNLINANLKLFSGKITKLADGTEWSKDFCN